MLVIMDWAVTHIFLIPGFCLFRQYYTCSEREEKFGLATEIRENLVQDRVRCNI